MSRVKPTIFREYIGVKTEPRSLDDFPAHLVNSEIPEFHFILGFATENYNLQGKGTGNFNATWNSHNFNAQKVKKLKKKCPNVKIIISIGGRGNDCAFDPLDESLWSGNAIKSLKEIITEYTGGSKETIIDGIDINYQFIKSGGNVFVECIGEVIRKLKKDQEITVDVVSISPSKDVQTSYKPLFQQYKSNIDYVNYQFYNETLTSSADFVKLFLSLSTDDYDVKKLLVGFSTDSSVTSKLKQKDFNEACTKLLDMKSLRGIFGWSANDSVISNGDEFSVEENIQELLTNYT